MAAAIIKLEGQEIQVTSEEIAQDDQKILAFISPFYPAYATANISRKQEMRGEEEITVITLSKKAGSKGTVNAVVEILQNAPVEVNSILSMSWQIKALCVNHPTFDFQTSLELTPKIEESIQAGRQEEQAVAISLKLLKSAKSMPSVFPIKGF